MAEKAELEVLLSAPEDKDEMLAKQNVAAMKEFEARMASAGMVMPKPPTGPPRKKRPRKT